MDYDFCDSPRAMGMQELDRMVEEEREEDRRRYAE